MSMPIDVNAMRIAEDMARLQPQEQDKSGDGEGFSKVLEGLLEQADEMHKASHQKLDDFASGKIDDVHDVMIAMNRADVSFRMMLEVRNKLVDAYQEVMRIQV
ncbi:MAG: flagellar hook-basal body complex protein FliE [Planctomycetes bacterium]|nr:flagellar hook-basal body complex protein FliE [Planctomycetota bacterium]